DTYRRTFRAGGYETYTAAGLLTSMVDASGNATTLSYDGSGKLATVTAPGGRALTLGYTGARVTTLSGPGGLVASYAYDGSNRLQQITYADAAGSGFTFAYDNNGALLTVTDLTGRVVEAHTYDASGNGVSSERGDGQERVTLEYLPNQTRVTDALGNVTTYTYKDIWGQRLVTTVTGPCHSCGGGQ